MYGTVRYSNHTPARSPQSLTVNIAAHGTIYSIICTTPSRNPAHNLELQSQNDEQLSVLGQLIKSSQKFTINLDLAPRHPRFFTATRAGLQNTSFCSVFNSIILYSEIRRLRFRPAMIVSWRAATTCLSIRDFLNEVIQSLENSTQHTQSYTKKSIFYTRENGQNRERTNRQSWPLWPFYAHSMKNHTKSHSLRSETADIQDC